MIYTAERDSKQILYTMQGKDIIKGNTNAILAFDPVEGKHLAHFKIQVCEVSSHFVGGLINLIVEVKHSLLNQGIFINPLIVRDIKVKAKELR